MITKHYQKVTGGEFHGGPVGKTLCFHGQGPGSIPGQGTKISQAVQWGQEKKKVTGNNSNTHPTMALLSYLASNGQGSGILNVQ